MSTLCRDCLTLDPAPTRRCRQCRSPRLVVHAELESLSIAHLDCDAFYASVEKRDRPELRDQPVIVGGARRGVVTTACYIARLSGVRSAMPMFEARRLCPNAVIVSPDFTKYRAESRRIFDKVRALTPLVEPLSLDEAWIDLSGTQRLHGAPPALTLARLQAEIEREIGLGVSIGLAPNKFLAKIASELDKPRGFAAIGRAEAIAFLAPRPVSILPGVGAAFAKTLIGDGLATVGDIGRADIRELAARYGSRGLRLAHLARGEDIRAVDPHQGRKSISAETTFEIDLSRLADLEDRLWPLCERVARQARAAGVAGGVITLKLRHTDFRVITRRRTAPAPTQTAKTLFSVSRQLLGAEARGAPWRLIGVGLSDLAPAAVAEDELFRGGEGRVLDGERAADRIRARFGPDAVISARGLASGLARGARKSGAKRVE